MTPEQQFKRFNRDLIDLIEKKQLEVIHSIQQDCWTTSAEIQYTGTRFYF